MNFVDIFQILLESKYYNGKLCENLHVFLLRASRAEISEYLYERKVLGRKMSIHFTYSAILPCQKMNFIPYRFKNRAKAPELLPEHTLYNLLTSYFFLRNTWNGIADDKVIGCGVRILTQIFLFAITSKTVLRLIESPVHWFAGDIWPPHANISRARQINITEKKALH